MGAFESGDCQGLEFRRGDVTADRRVTISDPVAVLHGLFRTGDALGCEKSADGNDDGRVNVADAVSILQFLFTSGARALPGPFPDCGHDTTSDDLSCDASPSCP